MKNAITFFALLLFWNLPQQARAEGLSASLLIGGAGFNDSPYFNGSKTSGLADNSAAARIEIAMEYRLSPKWSLGFFSYSSTSWPVQTGSDPKQNIIVSCLPFTAKYFPLQAQVQERWSKELYVGGGPEYCGVNEQRTGVLNTRTVNGALALAGGEIFITSEMGLVAEVKYELLPSVSTTLGDFNPSNYSLVFGLRYHFGGRN